MIRLLANPPDRFAPALAKVLDERAPFARHAVGLDARLLSIGSRLLPGRVLHHAVRRAMGLPPPGALQGSASNRPLQPASSEESNQHG